MSTPIIEDRTTTKRPKGTLVFYDEVEFCSSMEVLYGVMWCNCSLCLLSLGNP